MRSVSRAATAARSDTGMTITTSIPARAEASRTAWRSNSIHTRTPGILRQRQRLCQPRSDPELRHRTEYLTPRLSCAGRRLELDRGRPGRDFANMADGTVHSVTITYVAAVPGALANIQVTLDGANVFPSPVTADLSTIGLGTGGTAYVGFTGATGGDYENQDILNWVFTPTVQGTPITSLPLPSFRSVR